MKTISIYRDAQTRSRTLRYPNAATRQEQREKMLDQLLLVAVSIAGVVAALFFLSLS